MNESNNRPIDQGLNDYVCASNQSKVNNDSNHNTQQKGKLCDCVSKGEKKVEITYIHTKSIVPIVGIEKTKKNFNFDQIIHKTKFFIRQYVHTLLIYFVTRNFTINVRLTT